MRKKFMSIFLSLAITATTTMGMGATVFAADASDTLIFAQASDP